MLLPALAALGWAGGFARFAPGGDPAQLARLAVLLFFIPALGEELLFRAMLLPPRDIADKRRWQTVLAIACFVAWHPLQAFTIGPPWSELFLDPWFLTATALLGIALSHLFLRTGSIWPCAALHWLVVLGWKALGGGPFGG